MIINHNLGALNANRNMNINSGNASKSMEKLSSGLRINKAGDDAAGLAISEKMRGQIRGLDQASANAQDGISMIQTGEGALNETTSILQRMRELAVQGSNDTNTTDDRTQIQKEMNQLTSEVSRIGNNTEFNTQKLLNGTSGVVTAGATTTVGAVLAATTVTGAALNTAGVIDVGSAGTFTGTADESITFAKTATGWSLNGGADIVGTTVLYKGVTLDSAPADGGVPPAVSGDSWTIDLTAAAAATTTTTAASSAFTFQIGANQSQQFTAKISDMRSSALGISGTASATAAGVGTTAVVGASFVAIGASNDLSDFTTATTEHALDVSDATKSSAAIKVLDAATASVSAERAKLGAYSNRLDHTIANLGTSSENLTSAESRIRDVDMAKEMSTFSKNNILAQAAQAMLAQANQQPQQVLSLLR